MDKDIPISGEERGVADGRLVIIRGEQVHTRPWNWTRLWPNYGRLGANPWDGLDILLLTFSTQSHCVRKFLKLIGVYDTPRLLNTKANNRWRSSIAAPESGHTVQLGLHVDDASSNATLLAASHGRRLHSSIIYLVMIQIKCASLSVCSQMLQLTGYIVDCFRRVVTATFDRDLVLQVPITARRRF